MSMNTCVRGCECNISSNLFCRMMKSLPVTKYLPVYASPVEAAKTFKMLQLTCIGSFRSSHTHFEGMLPKKQILKRNCVLPVQSDMTHQCWHEKSCLKREIRPLHLDVFPCNPKIGVRFSHLVLWSNFLLTF